MEVGMAVVAETIAAAETTVAAAVVAQGAAAFSFAPATDADMHNFLRLNCSSSPAFAMARHIHSPRSPGARTHFRLQLSFCQIGRQ